MEMIESEKLEKSMMYNFSGVSFYFNEKSGRGGTQILLSYGQKRLLSFLYYCSLVGCPVIADELVNGLHHDWIETAMSRVRGVQSFLTSQNPLLFDYITFSSADHASQSLVICKVEKEGRVVWRNMDEAESGAFFSAYDLGFEKIGEILRKQRLW